MPEPSKIVLIDTNIIIYLTDWEYKNKNWKETQYLKDFFNKVKTYEFLIIPEVFNEIKQNIFIPPKKTTIKKGKRYQNYGAKIFNDIKKDHLEHINNLEISSVDFCNKLSLFSREVELSLHHQLRHNILGKDNNASSDCANKYKRLLENKDLDYLNDLHFSLEFKSIFKIFWLLANTYKPKKLYNNPTDIKLVFACLYFGYRVSTEDNDVALTIEIIGKAKNKELLIRGHALYNIVYPSL